MEQDSPLLGSLIQLGAKSFDFIKLKPTGYLCGVFLRLYDGCGNLLETWEFIDATMENINFGELDYSSRTDIDLEFTFKYQKYTYTQEPTFPWTYDTYDKGDNLPKP